MNKRWVDYANKSDLMFRKFGGDEECVLSFTQSKEDKTCFLFVSEDLKVEYDYEFFDSVEEAKEAFEEMYAEHIRDEISYYETLLENWEEE